MGYKWFVFFIFSFILVGFVSAGSLGMSPSYFKFNFEPNLEKTIEIRIANSDITQSISVYKAGDLTEYTNLSTSNFTGVGILIVSLKLPRELDRPGVHRLIIGSNENKSSQDNGIISGASAIQVPIDIFVPYPGQYAEIELNIPNVNEGEDVPCTMIINSLGTQEISFVYSLDIYDSSNVSVYHLENNSNLGSNKKRTMQENIPANNFKPGEYVGFFNLDYGKKISANSSFRVGSFSMNITDYDYRFISGRINSFSLSASSQWNSEIEDVYSEISVTDSGVVKSYFKTSNYDFAPLENKILSGYVDATNITPGKYVGNIILNYGDKKTSKLVAFYFDKPEITSTEKFLIVAVIAIIFFIFLIIILIIWLIILKRRKKK